MHKRAKQVAQKITWCLHRADVQVDHLVKVHRQPGQVEVDRAYLPRGLDTLQVTNVNPYDDDYGATVTVLVNDCHYGYSRFDPSSAAFGTFEDYSAGVAWVDVDVVRWSWYGNGWLDAIYII